MNAGLQAVATRPEELRGLFALQQAAFLDEMNPDLAVRLDRLDRLARMNAKYEAPLAASISADFGARSRQETLFAEVAIVETGIRYARRRLKRWMKPQRARTALQFLPGYGRILRQPLGVVGVVAPWNYPYQLAIMPVVGALAAGNRALIKPSELTPRTAQLLREMIGEFFVPDELAVIVGDAEIGKAFTELPFDHLVFTGSAAVGRRVAAAAARNLTPVTLELGGKSPAIIDASADFERSVERLIFGKLLNAGQTCIAPDYVMVPRTRVEALVAAARRQAATRYPGIEGNPDYTSIVSEGHYARLVALLEDARAKGARIVELGPEGEIRDPARRQLPPALALDVNDQMRIMQEEIFGPLLPVLPYDRVEDAVRYVNRHDRPLALYWFGEDRAQREYVLANTISGGVTVNDCLLHVAQEDLPFGGVGPSGHGAYHGEHGFRAFSKEKPVFVQRRLAPLRLLYPPYGKRFDRILSLVRRLTQ